MENTVKVTSPTTPKSDDTTDKLDISPETSHTSTRRKLDNTDMSTKDGMEKLVQKELAKVATVNEDDDDDDDEEEDEDEVVVSQPKKLTKEDLQIDLSLSGLLESTGQLDEDVKIKTQRLFETAVLSEVNRNLYRVHEALNEEYSQQAYEMREDINESLDTYLDNVVNEFIEYNEETLGSTIREERLAEFFEGVVSLAEEAGVDVDTDGQKTIEAVEAENKKLKDELNKLTSDMIANKQVSVEKKSDEVKSKVSEGLSLEQTEQLEMLSEYVTYTDELDYEVQLTDIKENIILTGDQERYLTEDVNVYSGYNNNRNINKPKTDIDILTEQVTRLNANQNKHK